MDFDACGQTRHATGAGSAQEAATLNYRDLLIVKGGYGSRQKFPLVPLSDGAGVIKPSAPVFESLWWATGSFFESWINSEPSDAFRAALGGAVDGVLAVYRLFPAQAFVRRRST